MTRALPARTFLALLAALASAPALAQQALPTPQPVIQAPAPADLRPALWKVADADTTIWLFGTVHALPKDMVWLDGPIATALESSDELVTEIPMGDDVGALEAVAAMALLPPGQQLRPLMNAKDRKAYEAAMTGFGLPVEAFDRYKPWYAAVVLSVLPLMRDGYAQENGVEKVLGARMQALSRRRGALETMKFQLGLFDSLPLASQTAYLSEVVTGIPTMHSEVDAMVKEWSEGDAETLAKLMNNDADDPLMMQRLLYDRNKTWAGWIKTRLDTPGTVFVAVGAGHLAGPSSVQDYLGQQGVTVTRVQ